MNFTIRQESKEDYNEIYNLIATAFQTAKVKDGTEQDFATALRNSENYLPELALVAEYDGKIIGHIMLTKTYVTAPDGKQYDTLMVAPLSVALEHRSLGVGAALISEGFRIALTLGYKSAFLCGDPQYYHRFGFHPIKEYGITHSSIPAPYVMGCELVPDALKAVTGSVRIE